MQKKKSTPLRRKLFLMILFSMVALLLCMGSVFLLLTNNIQKQEEKTLSGFSDEMVRLNIEEKKLKMHSQTIIYARHLCSLSLDSPFMFDPDSQSIFSEACKTAVGSFHQAGEIADYETECTLFMLSGDYSYSSEEQSKEEIEAMLNEIYSDERRQSEAVYNDPDGVSWVKNNESGDSYIETDEGLVSIAFNAPAYGLGDPLRVGVILRWNNKEQLLSAAEEMVSEHTDSANETNAAIFRRALIVIGSAALLILLLCLIYTRKLSEFIADPIELEQLRAKQEKEALEKADKMKTAFLSDASHELKTPLAAMSGYAQNAELELVKGAETSVIQEKLRRISSEANRMALMVTQILDATRIEEGRMVLELAPCDIDSLVRKVVETYFAVLNKNNNRLAIRIPLDLPEVSADASRLQRVLVNLVSNALKHTHNGTILIKAEQEEGSVRVTVKDTGSGISEEDMPHIWERYYKGKHSETGTGLGLFICKFIIESHGGRIWAESEPGKGSSFIFTLPAGK